MEMLMRITTSITVMILCVLVSSPGYGQGTGPDVGSTKHNLTTSGPGSLKVGRGSEVCMFCHTPHASNPAAPLWNRNDPGNYYETYESTTLVSEVGQPTGTSRLCLSCHDGTIALSQTYNPNGSSGGTIYITPADRGYIGTDLSDDHPISFTYDTAVAVEKGGLKDPDSISTLLPLDHNKQLQCTTCHDAHNDNHGNFLRMDNTQSKMCRSCHVLSGWENSSHANSYVPLTNAINDDWDNLDVMTVADAACESCHRPHSAGGRQRLLRFGAEEDNCLNCHDGSVAGKNISSELDKISIHDVRAATGVHDPTEDSIDMLAHVECVDCHGQHQVSGIGADVVIAPAIKLTMAGASGLTQSGQKVKRASYEYEVCYKCHSARNFAQPVVDRWLGTNDISKEFDAGNDSYHPIEASGKNTMVPSLFPELNTSTILYCTDCHGTDDSTIIGLHGSSNVPLLKKNYATLDNTRESPHAYELCYKCHNRASILGDDSFDDHKKHIEGEDAQCSACHDPHGVTGVTHLINFDRDIVFPARNGIGPIFEDRGLFAGSCTLTCHGKNHEDKDYKFKNGGHGDND